jgi:molecular chaperone GrpE
MKALLFITRMITIYVLIIILPFLVFFYNMTSHKKEKKEVHDPASPPTAETTSPSTGSISGDQTAATDLQNLQERLTKALQEKEEYLALLQRERADFMNYKKRVEEEKKDVIAFGQSLLLLKWIPLYELFIKAESHLPESLAQDDWVKGVLQIKALFEKLFSDLEVKKIETVGHPFDSNMHEAMMEVPGEKGMVIREFEAGYFFHGRVVKAAKVAVGNGEESRSEQASPTEQEPSQEKPNTTTEQPSPSEPSLDSNPTI